MGIFNNLFGKSEASTKEENKIPWIPLTTVEQLEEIAAQSHDRTQIIFKHSTTCGISRMVLSMFTSSYALGEDVDIYFLDLHAHRDVSNTVASKFQVMHQSPQLLVIKKGEVSFHTSHGTIADANLADYI